MSTREKKYPRPAPVNLNKPFLLNPSSLLAYMRVRLLGSNLRAFQRHRLANFPVHGMQCSLFYSPNPSGFFKNANWLATESPTCLSTAFPIPGQVYTETKYSHSVTLLWFALPLYRVLIHSSTYTVQRHLQNHGSIVL